MIFLAQIKAAKILTSFDHLKH